MMTIVVPAGAADLWSLSAWRCPDTLSEFGFVFLLALFLACAHAVYGFLYLFCLCLHVVFFHHFCDKVNVFVV